MGRQERSFDRAHSVIASLSQLHVKAILYNPGRGTTHEDTRTTHSEDRTAESKLVVALSLDLDGWAETVYGDYIWSVFVA
jgi:hypothetical protein